MMKATWNGVVLAESDQTIVVEGKRNTSAAWYYPAPKDAAKEITGYVAFWNGVKVAEE